MPGNPESGPTPPGASGGKLRLKPEPDKPPVDCPSCGAAIEPGTALCLSCGFSLRTGQRRRLWPRDSFMARFDQALGRWADALLTLGVVALLCGLVGAAVWFVWGDAGSSFIACGACSGQGVVPCGSCGGMGTADYGRLKPCDQCQGRGQYKLRLKSGMAQCPFCKGSGMVPSGDRQRCLACGARGVAACPACGGSGRTAR
jgi:predicted nucleic acid-binding Zn ribbon protein